MLSYDKFEELRILLNKKYGVIDLTIFYICKGKRYAVFGEKTFSEKLVDDFQCLDRTTVKENSLRIYEDMEYRSQLIMKLQGYERGGVKSYVNTKIEGLGKPINFEFLVVLSSNAFEVFKAPQGIITDIISFFEGESN